MTGALVSIQNAVMQILDHDGYRGPVDSGASLGTYLAGLVGLGVWIVILVGALSGK